MFTFGVFASGGGSNFKAILSHANDGSLGGACRFLVTNNASCGAVKIAEEQGIPVFHISSKTHPDKRDYEKALLQVVQKFPVDFVAL